MIHLSHTEISKEMMKIRRNTFATWHLWQQSVDKQPKSELPTLLSKDCQKHSKVKATFIMILPALMERETEVISFAILLGMITSNWIVLKEKYHNRKTKTICSNLWSFQNIISNQ